ncbi:predicted protein [Histoplasma mississippiense (nom. inval.)]|uniref:predicted protein n=2 Tax=Ajellomyces capsulatus (strain NAm1 / WU24) TaxID=2059318 RepID=UPI000157D638|nr:predicted protein [Histoplasma mississippiense (nom. inval.)]EDN06549.1 predicted protein [Histoplasma mississippiense (nom. inval.)]
MGWLAAAEGKGRGSSTVTGPHCGHAEAGAGARTGGQSGTEKIGRGRVGPRTMYNLDSLTLTL